MLTRKGETPFLSTHRYIVAIMLPEQAASSLLTIQSKYHLPLWQPKIDLHITLVSPFSSSETVKAVSARLAPIAAQTKPFPVGINGFGRFDNAESIFYAKVSANAKLTALANKTLKAIIDPRGSRTHQQFIPHITLSAPASRTAIDQYFTQSTPDSPHLSFACNHFSLLLLDERGRRWDILKKFLFKTTKRKASQR